MKKYEMMKMDRLTSSAMRYIVTAVLVTIIVLSAIVMLLFRTNAVMDVDAKIMEADILHIKPAMTSLEVARLNMSDSGNFPATSTANTGSAQFDQNIYDLLIAGGYGETKAIAMTYAWCTLGPMFSYEYAIGHMANIKAEGSPGLVEYTFAHDHAHGFSLPSGKDTVQNAQDVEYLKAWDSVTKNVYDKGVKKGSCGFGMAQMSFDRRVRLCDCYLQYVTDYTDIHQMAQAEINYIVSEVSSGGKFDNVPPMCVGKSAEECAKIVCNKFEMPGGSAQDIIRAGYATDIVKALESVYSR